MKLNVETKSGASLILHDGKESIQPFSYSFLEWADKFGFFAKDVWNFEKNKWEYSTWLRLHPIQRRVLSYALQMKDGAFKYNTVLYSAPKKSGKSACAAMVVAWFAEVAPAGTEIYILANDLEQAEGRVMRDFKYHANQRGYKVTQYKVELPNDTFVQVLAQNYKSVAGSRHALVVFDELWGITSDLSRRTYEEMTPIPTIPYSLRFISTYAGFYGESDLLWDLYVNGVGKDEFEDGRGKPIEELIDLPCWENGKQFTFWIHTPFMPWQNNPEYYRDQRATLRPNAYLRLHENRWVSSEEEFIPVSWYDQSCVFKESAETWPEHPYRSYPVFVGIDAAPKHDTTAVVGVTYDANTNTYVEIFHRVWKPMENEILDFDETIVKYILKMRQIFNIVSIGYDPSHMSQTALRLQTLGFQTVEYVQNSIIMVKVSSLLFDVFRTRSFKTWRDDVAREHIANARAKADKSSFRIVRPSSSRGANIDYAIALGIALHQASQISGVDLNKPIVIESPFADVSKFNHAKGGLWYNEDKLPWALRE